VELMMVVGRLFTKGVQLRSLFPISFSSMVLAEETRCFGGRTGGDKGEIFHISRI
jgi:hypothetical protein